MQSLKDRFHKKIRDEKLFRRKLRSKEKKKIKYRKRQGVSKQLANFRNKYRNHIKIKAPEIFSFLTNAEGTIKFINKIDLNFKKRNKVFIDIEHVTKIDYGAITVLLSVMKLFRLKHIEFDGNYPLAEEPAILLYNSGFMKSLYNRDKQMIYTFGKTNQLFTQNNKKVVAALGLPLMFEIGHTIYGEPRLFKGLQRVLLELMQNTNNHAVIENKGQKAWWLSVSYDKNNHKVSFSFVDYGVGIFESLKSKSSDNKWFGVFEIIKSRIRFGSNKDVLKLLLNGELHRTVTGQHFRGKGIPGINQVQERNQISNLHVITNDAYANVKNNEFIKLRNYFSGTFVYWEITNLNKCNEWNIKSR